VVVSTAVSHARHASAMAYMVTLSRGEARDVRCEARREEITEEEEPVFCSGVPFLRMGDVVSGA